MANPIEYKVERALDALAADPATGELGIKVEVAGTRILLTGMVPNQDRSTVAERIVREAIPDHDVVNGLEVASDLPTPPPPEKLE